MQQQVRKFGKNGKVIDFHPNVMLWNGLRRAVWDSPERAKELGEEETHAGTVPEILRDYIQTERTDLPLGAVEVSFVERQPGWSLICESHNTTASVIRAMSRLLSAVEAMVIDKFNADTLAKLLAYSGEFYHEGLIISRDFVYGAFKRATIRMANRIVESLGDYEYRHMPKHFETLRNAYMQLREASTPILPESESRFFPSGTMSDLKMLEMETMSSFISLPDLVQYYGTPPDSPIEQSTKSTIPAEQPIEDKAEEKTEEQE